ncbi:M48 family metalloprotease [Holospora curviuscula]|uniref:TPR repeat-containing protein YfgC n=1 Tax=Holospora curviuscula TaxID=1082868 RepID=A0A2S5R7V8_9PROT|nr:M48 family metalloprotease [Holospora curviuscula]PPE03205.1 TPR repeat-containing protein YfgC precursor [Holospora curviuscula]
MKRFVKILGLIFGLTAWGMPLRFEEGSVVYDSQVENFLNTVCAPAFTILGGALRSRVRFHLVNSETINAFAVKNGNIFINIGVFLAADRPEEVIGVLFHELGHVACDHITKAIDLMKSLEMRSVMFRVLAGVAAGMTALAARDGLQDVLPGFFGGSTLIDLTALTDMMHFSRAQEGAADQFALDLLKTLRWSMDGLATFMEKLVRTSGPNTTPLYLRTHPCSLDRLTSIQDARKRSRPAVPLAPWVYHEFFKIKTKLLACTPLNGGTSLTKFRHRLAGIPKSYHSIGESIFFHRRGKSKEALAALERFEKIHQKDAFTWELRAQILFESGNLPHALKAIHTALTLRPKDVGIKTYAAIIALDSTDPKEWKRSVASLEGAVFGPQKNPQLWYWLGIALGKLNRIGEMHVAMAECAMGKGAIKEAKQHTHLALIQLKNLKPSVVIHAYTQKYLLRARDLERALKDVLLSTSHD